MDPVENSDLDAVDPLAEQAVEEPVVEEAAEAEAQPTPAAQPQQSGIQIDAARVARENAWLRQTLADSTSRIDALTAQLDELEISQLPDDEAGLELVRRREERLQERERKLQEQQHKQQWRTYFEAFDVPPEIFEESDDPIQWQHGVLTHQQQKIVELLDTVAAVKKVQEQSSVPKPKVTAKQTSSAPHETLWDIPLDKILKMGEQARHGLITAEDLPPLE
jgi:hypothetical protein